MNNSIEKIDEKITVINETMIIDIQSKDIFNKLINTDYYYKVFTIYLPYPEIHYSIFGKGLSSNYKKHINCQMFINKMFGNKIINNLSYKEYDINITNYNRLNGIYHTGEKQIKLQNIEGKKFKRPDKKISENEGKMKKEKDMRALFKQYTDPEQKHNIRKINSIEYLTKNNKNVLKKSIRLQKSDKRFKDFYNMVRNSKLNISKKELDSLLISPKLKKELFNKLQKKLTKKSKLQIIKNYIKSIKIGKKTKHNNRQTRIRKRIMISKLKKNYPNEPDVKHINSNTITIKTLSNIYKKHYKERVRMINLLENKQKKENLYLTKPLNNMRYGELYAIYKKVIQNNTSLKKNKSFISKTKKKLKKISNKFKKNRKEVRSKTSKQVNK